MRRVMIMLQLPRAGIRLVLPKVLVDDLWYRGNDGDI
jgi:hypothetical protein